MKETGNGFEYCSRMCASVCRAQDPPPQSISLMSTEFKSSQKLLEAYN